MRRETYFSAGVDVSAVTGEAKRTEQIAPHASGEPAFAGHVVIRHGMAEGLLALQPARLVLPAIALSAAASVVRSGVGVGIATLWVGILAIGFFLVPGLVAMRVLRWGVGLDDWEQLLPAFALSTLHALVLGAIILTIHASIGWGIALLLAVVADGLVWLTLRPAQPPFTRNQVAIPPEIWVLVAVWTIIAAVASLAGAPITSADQVELVTLRKLAESLGPGWASITFRPDVVGTSMLTPHHVLIASIAWLSGVELVGVYEKLRFVYVLLVGASAYAIARAVLGSVRGAFLASLIAATWVVTDPHLFSTVASLWPLVGAGAIASGLLLPAAALFALDSVRAGGWERAPVVALLSVAILMTHAIEAAQFYVFLIGGAVVGALAARRDSSMVRRTGVLLLVCAVTLGAFQLIDAQPLQFDAPSPNFIGAPAQILAYPLLALLAGAAVISIRRAPMAAWLWTVLALGFLLLLVARFTGTPTVDSVFGLLTLVSLPVLASATDTAFSRLYRALRSGGGTPPIIPISLAAVGVLVLFVSLSVLFKLLPGQPSDSARPTLFVEGVQAWDKPDPLDFETSYAKGGPALPWEVIVWLRQTLPPERVLLAQPDHVDDLAVYLDQYVAPQSNDLDRRFLRASCVQYILVEPGPAASLGARLDGDTTLFKRLSTHGEYALFEVQQTPLIVTPAQPAIGVGQCPPGLESALNSGASPGGVAPGSTAAAASPPARVIWQLEAVDPAQLQPAAFALDPGAKDGIARDADGSPLYQTRKGGKSERQLHDELAASGYVGPEDIATKLYAYDLLNQGLAGH